MVDGRAALTALRDAVHVRLTTLRKVVPEENEVLEHWCQHQIGQVIHTHGRMHAESWPNTRKVSTYVF